MQKYFILILFLLPLSIISGTNHYVDNAANGSNNGTSWGSAWESFSDINWSLIDPGDIIYISGGSSSKTYTSGISVNASGSSGQPITITKGIDANHNGEVIFQGSGSGTALNIVDESYVTVSNFTINNWNKAVSIDGGHSDATRNIIVDNCDGVMKGRFVFIQGHPDITGSYCHDITVRNCDVVTPSSTGSQNDFIYAQYMAGLIVEGNNVNIASNDASQHNDLIQTYWVDGPVIVRNNYFEHSDNKQRNSQGIFFENHEGDYYIYNNIIVMPNSLDGKIYWKSSSLNDAHTFIYSNISYGKAGSLIKTTDPNAIIKNNILYSTGYQSNGSSHMLEFNGVSGNNADVSNNLFYDPAGNMSNQNSGNCTDCDEDDPLFNNISARDFTLQESSPAIDMGATLGSPYSIDMIGTLRPQGLFFDTGAYESVDNGNGNYIVVNQGWNLLSIPKLSSNMSVDYLLPTRTSQVFEYNGTNYQEVTILQNGKGYAVEFGYPQYIFIDGASVSLSIEVSEGWNLVGPFDQNISISNLYTVPSGIIESDFWGFGENGLIVSNILEVGKGYWVKVSEDGTINLNSGTMGKEEEKEPIAKIEQTWGIIKITDNEGKSINLYATSENTNLSLYEMPPVPPNGVFDARYESGKIVENINTEKTVQLQSKNYPITIKADGISFSIRDMVTGEMLDERLENGDEIRIMNSNLNSFKVIEQSTSTLLSSYELTQNYPNPFNPSTTIEFSLPEDVGLVQLSIYNVLGEKVIELVNTALAAGNYSYTWNAKNVATGMYIYELRTEKFISVKKMVLTK